MPVKIIAIDALTAYLAALLIVELITTLMYHLHVKHAENAVILSSMLEEMQAIDDAEDDVPPITLQDASDMLTEEEAEEIIFDMEKETMNETFKSMLALAFGDAFANIMFYMSATLLDKRYSNVKTQIKKVG